MTRWGWMSVFVVLLGVAGGGARRLLVDASLPVVTSPLLVDASEGVVLRAVVAVAGVLCVEALRRAIAPRAPSDSHGSAAFADPPRAWIGERGPPRAGADPRSRCADAGAVCLGTHRGRLVCLPRSLALRHGMILGPSGSGKSFGFFLPNAALGGDASRVFTDPKSELWRRSARMHPRAHRFAPGEPDRSAAFNFVPLCRDARMAEILARAVVLSGNTQRTEQVWIDLEAGFLSALFAHAATLSEPTPLSAYQLFVRQPPEALLAQLGDSESPIAREQANLLRQTSERMRASVLPAVAARLQFLRDPAVARFTSSVREPPRFDRLRAEPQALFWCLREQDVVRLRPLSAVFFTVLIEQLVAGGAVADDAVPVTLFLDEFAALGALPDFDTLIALARGRGIAIWLGLQSLSQLEGRYGKSAAQTILTNCGTKLTLPGLDFESARYVSRSLGEQTRPTSRRTWHMRMFAPLPHARAIAEAEHGRPLLTADEVRRLPEEDVVVLALNCRPFRLTRRLYEAPPAPTPPKRLGAARSV